MIYTKARYENTESVREIENRKVSYTAATEGVVLLHNNGVLPLQESNVALFGPGAFMTIKGGTGSGEVKERRVISILEGMLERGYSITYNEEHKVASIDNIKLGQELETKLTCGKVISTITQIIKDN